MSAHTPGFPGYLIQSDGRVFSVGHNWRGHGTREMLSAPDRDGYPCVRLTLDGKRRKYRVHRLVAKVYLPPQPSPGHEVRHLDGDTFNAAASNLAWGTQKDNADDRARHGRTSHGEQHSIAIKRGLQVARQESAQS
jgi:hypothetical protein